MVRNTTTLTKLRELRAKATKWPWWIVPIGHNDWRICCKHPSGITCSPSLGVKCNAEYVAAAINALPALLAVAEAAVNVIDSGTVADNNEGNAALYRLKNAAAKLRESEGV